MELKLDDDREDAEADEDELNEGQGAKKSITVNIEQLGNWWISENDIHQVQEIN